MKKFLVLLLLIPSMPAQVDLSPVLDPIDQTVGEYIPPTLDTVYGLIGQNVTREDVRLYIDLNVTQGGVGLLGLLLGSGKAQLEATLHARGEMRVISSERIRAAIEGENAYEIEAENATFLSEVYLPAEVFRATATAEVIAAFQAEQELALRKMIEDMVPEMEILRLDIAWDNVHPFETLSDFSLTETPIVVTIDAAVRYLRVESIPNLLGDYIAGRSSESAAEKDAQKEYIAQLKEENSDPLRARDFYAAAAFSQLLNVSMQPGWQLVIDVALPRGYSLEYTSRAIDQHNPRQATIEVDALESDSDVQEVLVFSITHRKAVALALFITMSIISLVGSVPTRWLYDRFRFPKKRQAWSTDS